MTAEDVAAASLAAWARGEIVCVPALEDVSLLERITTLQREAISTAAFSPALASRYRSGTP